MRMHIHGDPDQGSKKTNENNNKKKKDRSEEDPRLIKLTKLGVMLLLLLLLPPTTACSPYLLISSPLIPTFRRVDFLLFATGLHAVGFVSTVYMTQAAVSCAAL